MSVNCWTTKIYVYVYSVSLNFYFRFVIGFFFSSSLNTNRITHFYTRTRTRTYVYGCTHMNWKLFARQEVWKRIEWKQHNSLWWSSQHSIGQRNVGLFFKVHWKKNVWRCVVDDGVHWKCYYCKMFTARLWHDRFIRIIVCLFGGDGDGGGGGSGIVVAVILLYFSIHSLCIQKYSLWIQSHAHTLNEEKTQENKQIHTYGME